MKILGGLIGFAFAFLVILHLLVNNQASLGFLLNQLKRFSGLEIQTRQFSFNALTGYFTGDSLRVVSTKKHFELELGQFNLRLKPAKLILGQIEIEEIITDKFSLKLIPHEKAPKKTAQGNVEAIYQELVEAFYLTKADITNIDIWADGGVHLWVKQLNLEAGYPLFFNEREIKAQLKSVGFQSDKWDFFLDTLDFDGAISRGRTLTPFPFRPSIEGRVQLSDALVALPKKPNPWNNNPPFEESIIPLLKSHYGDTIPDSRTFAHVKRLDLPFSMDASSLKTDDLVLEAFNGRLTGHFSLDNSKLNVKLSTLKPLYWPLMPLGKSNLRQSYKEFTLDLEARGTYKNMAKNQIKGFLKTALKKTHAYPNGPDLVLNVPLQTKDGVLTADDLKITVGEGTLKADASVDLPRQTLNVSAGGDNLDSQAVIRLFSSIDIPGKANVNGTIKGSLTNPKFDVKVTSPGFGYESLFFGSFEGGLKIADQNLKLEGKSSLEGTGRGNVDLTINSVFKSADQTVDLKTDFTDLPAGRLMNSAALTGSVKGFFNLQKRNHVYRGEGEVHISEAQWYSLPIKRADVVLKAEDKYLHLEKGTIQWNEATPAFTNTRRVSFHFTPEGYTFDGQLTPTANITGSYDKRNPFTDITIDLKKSPLDMLKPLIATGDAPPVASGQIKIRYALGKPEESQVEAAISSFDFNYKGHPLTLNRPTTVSYRQKKVEFKGTQLSFGQGRMELNGILGLTDNSSLRIKGTQDIETLAEFTSFLVEGAGIMESDIEWIGPYTKPAFKGRIRLDHAELRLRSLPGELSGLTGELNLDGERITAKNLRGDFDDSPAALDGWFDYNAEKGIYAADLKIRASEMPLNKADSWRVLGDMDLHLRGSQPLTLGGSINLIEGTYFRDYSLSQFILKPVGVSYPQGFEIPEWLQQVALDLSLKTSGDFLVDNNIGKISLKGDLLLKGPVANPAIAGIVDVLDGEIQAFGLDFENARGFINFDPQNPYVPYIDFQANQEIQNYLVKALIRGHMDNLELSFESQPALNKNEIVSLIAFGRTPDQLNDADRNLFSRAAIASQIVSIFQGPLSRATHLDVVKLNASRRSNEALLSEFSIGKRLSDRVTFAFTTDLSLDEAYKGVVLEYQFLDNLLLKGSKDTGSRYRFDLTWRLEAY